MNWSTEMFARDMRAQAWEGQRMGTASVVAAIGFGAAVFMLGFLIALLREGAPSVRYWVARALRKPQREGVQVLSAAFDGCGAGRELSDGRVELLENENHEKEKSGSGLIALDVRTISGGVGWRAIHSKRSFVLRERRL
jgi:hypothetical protein